MKKTALVTFFLLGFSLFAGANDVVGTWYTEGKGAKVKIYKSGSTYNGKIVWLKEPVYEDGHENAGSPKLDENNPDPDLQSRKIVGIRFLWGFSYDDGTYEGGKIYDPESGKTYHCKMEIDGETLRVRGSLDRFGLAGRTQKWTPASD